LLLAQGALDLPAVGGGQTSDRHAALCAFGREDLSLARVVEAHADAIAILAEAAHPARTNALYGLWASDGPGSQLDLVETASADLVLRGAKRYCSGSTFLDAALVTAHRGDELLLIDVSLHSKERTFDTSEWKSPAFAATATGTVEFHDMRVSRQQIVRSSRWYLDRPGFWHGAIGPAACWAGGAMGLVDAAVNARRESPRGPANLGALEAMAWGMTAMLDRAGREIDADPQDNGNRARKRALSARHLVERACMDIMDHFGRATGPALLACDEAIARRYAELTLYIRQCHAG
jgi:alkylation response protein AidB-like acyl-CoA dehydrogenase